MQAYPYDNINIMQAYLTDRVRFQISDVNATKSGPLTVEIKSYNNNNNFADLDSYLPSQH